MYQSTLLLWSPDRDPHDSWHPHTDPRSPALTYGHHAELLKGSAWFFFALQKQLQTPVGDRET